MRAKKNVQFVGPWDQTRVFLSVIDKKIVKEAREALGNAAEAFRQDWRESVKTGSLNLYPKSKLTIETTSAKKTTPLVYTLDYHNAIHKSPSGYRSASYFVGISPGTHKKTGRPIIEIAAKMEYGGVIRAKKKFLAVPATPKARRYNSPRDYPWIRGPVYRRHKGGAYRSFGGMYEVLSTGKLKIVYYMFKEVFIPVRPAMQMVFNKYHMLLSRTVGTHVLTSFNNFAEYLGVPGTIEFNSSPL